MNHAPLYALSQALPEKILAVPHTDMIFDIGANQGDFSASHACRGRVIHAYEPVPDMFSNLALTSELVPHGQIVPHNLGLSSTPGTLKNLSVFRAWVLLPQDSKEDRALEYKDQPGFDVQMSTLDEQSLLLGDPDFIKLDVDGYEYAVLMGGIRLLSRNPCPILFEYSGLGSLVEDPIFGDPVVPMLELIYDLGYRMWSMDGSFCAKDPFTALKHYPKHSSYDVMLLPKGFRL